MTKAELIDVIEDLYPLAICHSAAYAVSHGMDGMHPDHDQMISQAKHVIDNQKSIIELDE